MSGFPAPLAATAVLIAGAAALAACGTNAEIDLPEDSVAKAPAPQTYVKPFGAALETEYAQDDDAYLDLFVRVFTSMTPENAMKWAEIHPDEDEFDFAAADELVEVARRTNKRVRGHTLVWDVQLPDWVADEDWEPRDLAGVLRRHIRRVVGRYRGQVAEWDVVNEPFNRDGSWTRNVFYRALGPRYVDIAFRAARAADPGAKLFLNENGAELPGPKARALLALAAELARRGVPIDGVGYQNHMTVLGFPSRKLLGARFAALARLGLLGAITEMDVTIPASDAPADAVDRQTLAYRDAAQACKDAPNCTGFTVWGVTDEFSWRGAGRRPLLFGSEGGPKPAFFAVQQTLGRR